MAYLKLHAKSNLKKIFKSRDFLAIKKVKTSCLLLSEVWLLIISNLLTEHLSFSY